MRGAIFAATAAALVLSACSSDPAQELTGCFAVSSDADRATLRVTEQDGKYALSSRSNGLWSAAQPLTTDNEKLVEQVFGNDADKVIASLGLADGSITLYKVEAGQKIAGGTADSGYLASFFFGTGQIYKAESCES